MENTNETKICNLDYLKSHSPNNPKFVAEMLQMFLKQTPANLLEISRAIAASDWSGVHGNIHKIRPSIDLIGMPKEISAAAKEMEEYCKAQTNLELVAPLFLKVETAFHKAYIELAEELKGINSSITQA